MTTTKPKLGEGATPGPWKVLYDPDTDPHPMVETVAQVNGEYRHITNGMPYFPHDEMLANARLIAKAPSLVEVRDVLADAKAALQHHGHFGDPAVLAIEALLAKLDAE